MSLLTGINSTTNKQEAVKLNNSNEILTHSSTASTEATLLLVKNDVSTLAATVNQGGEQKVSVSSENYGTHGNLLNNATLNAGAVSSSLSISEIATGNLFYQDSNTGILDEVEIQVSVDNVNFYTWGVIKPYTTGSIRIANVTGGSAHGLRYIRLKNLSSSVNYNNVYATICGSH